MINSCIDPEYYDGENHGYWLLSNDWGWRRQLEAMSHEAVKAGIACYLWDAPGYIPF